MRNWETETGRYINRIENVSELLDKVSEPPVHIPKGPLTNQPTELQSYVHRAVHFLQLGSWIRARETTSAILQLWEHGNISAAAPLVRLVYEIWAVTNFLVIKLEKYQANKNIETLAKVVNKVFEGAKIEILMPWGSPATEAPVHVLDAFRELSNSHSHAMNKYEYLCESSHPNYPRYIELWLLGKEGDNWTNDKVFNRGHELLESTTSALEEAVTGLNISIEKGFELCGEYYKLNA
ncbi:hypothetical protein [Sulfuriflexus mobilis]|uniref:hypothetical protein n=1 Tax=Sulfuriflexus mobilis TaxID=1811807 RepID=UPI000F82DF40|nr:hypothetical protein [Sulfuriflexus mobilis]